MTKLTRQQVIALKRVYDKTALGMSYLAFRRTACLNTIIDCVMVPWQGMWLGIETDGYTHS